jgi:hypothetical protein
MAQRADAQVETKGYLSATSSVTALIISPISAGMQGDLKRWADQLRVRATDVGTVSDEPDDLADTWSRTARARRTQAPPPSSSA